MNGSKLDESILQHDLADTCDAGLLGDSWNYAIQALNQSATYYLLKLVEFDELIKSEEKIQQEHASGITRSTSV